LRFFLAGKTKMIVTVRENEFSFTRDVFHTLN
jgi:hypothetical protein